MFKPSRKIVPAGSVDAEVTLRMVIVAGEEFPLHKVTAGDADISRPRHRQGDCACAAGGKLDVHVLPAGLHLPREAAISGTFVDIAQRCREGRRRDQELMAILCEQAVRSAQG